MKEFRLLSIILYRIVLPCILLILCLLTIYELFCVKDNVLNFQLEIDEIKKQIKNEEDNIRIFKAELAYLSYPTRIKMLARKYLALEKGKFTQIVEDPLKKENIVPAGISIKKITKKNNKWRYKKGPTKYLDPFTERSNNS